MGAVSLNIPFLLISSKVVLGREIEKRYITPFGTVDLTFRSELDMKTQKAHLVVKFGGDAEHWVSCEARVHESTMTLLHFVWGIAKDHLTEKVRAGFSEVNIEVKGYEMDLKIPWEDIFVELKVLNSTQPAAD